MNIGAILKKYRLNKNKTQQEWIGDIISPSFYSKVENNEHRISAEDFLEILDKNNININEFLSYMESNKTMFENYNDKIIDAFFNNDIDNLKYLLIEISEDKSINEDETKLLKALIKCITAYLINDDNIINDDTIKYLKNKFFSLENWNIFKLTLYVNIMSLYDFQSNNDIISSILKKDLNLYNEEQQDTILIIIINFLSMCISNNQDDLAKYYLQIMNKINPTISNFFQKNIILYYDYLIKYRTESSKQDKIEILKIIEGIDKIGFEDFASKLKEYFHENMSKRN